MNYVSLDIYSCSVQLIYFWVRNLWVVFIQTLCHRLLWYRPTRLAQVCMVFHVGR